MTAMKSNDMQIRVAYADTDQMGMVYYANYLVFFERGRTEWLREHGLTYRQLEEQGNFFPVVECNIQYMAPARYDDLLTVRTTLAEIGFASIVFSYEIINNDKVIVTGMTRHPLVNREFRPTRMPGHLRTLLEKSHA